MCKFKLNIDEWSRAKCPEVYLAKYKNLIAFWNQKAMKDYLISAA